eukprot:COSAG02_NODE_1206_length_13888_cov_15.018130_7_plen_214_part_00
MPPADTTKRSLQPRSSPSVAPKPHQTLRPSGLQPLSNLRVIPSRSTHTGLKTLAQICRRDGDEDGDEDDREGGVQDTGLFFKGRVARRRQQLEVLRLLMLSVVATHRLVERLLVLALDHRVVLLALTISPPTTNPACARNATPSRHSQLAPWVISGHRERWSTASQACCHPARASGLAETNLSPGRSGLGRARGTEGGHYRTPWMASGHSFCH